MARPDKEAAVAELRDRFSNSAGAVLTEYRGLTVKALRDLRRSLGENATYAVSKNTLTTIAARQAGIEGIEEHLVGPTAIAFIDGDPVTVAKGLRDFGRANPHLVIKGGILDGKLMGPDEVRRLADLESREVLLAKVAGGLQGVLQQAVSLFAAPLSQAARVIGALEAAAVDNPSLLAAAAPVAEDTREPTNEELAAEVSSEPTNEELAAEAVPEPTNEELAAEVSSEPTNEQLSTEAAPAADLTEAAPAADVTEAAPAADVTEAAPAAEESTTVAAHAAEEN